MAAPLSKHPLSQHQSKDGGIWHTKMERTPQSVPYLIDLIGGDEGDRTPDLMNAIHALSQLSYVPTISF